MLNTEVEVVSHFPAHYLLMVQIIITLSSLVIFSWVDIRTSVAGKLCRSFLRCGDWSWKCFVVGRQISSAQTKKKSERGNMWHRVIERQPWGSFDVRDVQHSQTHTTLRPCRSRRPLNLNRLRFRQLSVKLKSYMINFFFLLQYDTFSLWMLFFQAYFLCINQ